MKGLYNDTTYIYIYIYIYVCVCVCVCVCVTENVWYCQGGHFWRSRVSIKKRKAVAYLLLFFFPQFTAKEIFMIHCLSLLLQFLALSWLKERNFFFLQVQKVLVTCHFFLISWTWHDFSRFIYLTKGVAPSSSSYWKGSLWVTLNYSCQLYLLILSSPHPLPLLLQS